MGALPIPGLNLSSGGEKMLIFGVVGIVVLGGTAFVIHKANQKKAESDSRQDLGNSPDAQVADQMLAILHPYSYKKLPQLDLLDNLNIALDRVANVDEKAAIELGKSIKNYTKVADYYYKLTGNRVTLDNDLKLMLNATEYKAFWANVNKSKIVPNQPLKPFKIYAHPTGATIVTVYGDSSLRKPLAAFKEGQEIGLALSKVTVKFKTGSNVVLYYVQGTGGIIKDKNVYVLFSQTGKTKR